MAARHVDEGLSILWLTVGGACAAQECLAMYHFLQSCPAMSRFR